MPHKNLVDIKENDILTYDNKLLPILLKDNSTKQNILWATDNYLSFGDGYGADDQITIFLLHAKNVIYSL